MKAAIVSKIYQDCCDTHVGMLMLIQNNNMTILRLDDDICEEKNASFVREIMIVI